MSILAPDGEAFSQERRQAGFNDFLVRGRHIVPDASLFDIVCIEIVDAIRSTPIAVAWLANAADIDEIFSFRFDADFFQRKANHRSIADIEARCMSVSKKANLRFLLGKARGGIELIEHIAPFAWSLEGGVDDGEISNLSLQAKVA